MHPSRDKVRHGSVRLVRGGGQRPSRYSALDLIACGMKDFLLTQTGIQDQSVVPCWRNITGMWLAAGAILMKHHTVWAGNLHT